MTERKRAELKPLSANAFKNIGWALGFLFSVLFPKLTAPMKLTMPFDIAATIAAMFGFIVTFSVFKQASLSVGKKLGIGGAAIVVGLGTWAWYRALLLSPENVTPSLGIEILEFVLYTVAYFCFFIVLAMAYREGGPYLFRYFGRNPVAGA